MIFGGACIGLYGEPSCTSGFHSQIKEAGVNKSLKACPALMFFQTFLGSNPFPYGGLFPSWQLLKEKDNHILWQPESRFRSGSWGGKEFSGWVFKSYLYTSLVLVTSRREEVAIVCFYLATQKRPQWEDRKRRCLLGQEPHVMPEWHFLRRTPLLIPIEETFGSATKASS